jgi:hypothetical protein
MRLRSVVSELEAHLSGADDLHGKAEWKTYADGSRQCRVRASKLPLPDGAEVEILLEGVKIARVAVDGGRVSFRRETERGEDVPAAAAGQTLRVVHVGSVVLEGTFHSE